MATPTPGNMNICNPKCKCSVGPYAGLAYSCDNPCAGQGEDCTFSCDEGCNCNGSTLLYGMFVTSSRGNSFYDNTNLPAMLLPVDLNPYFDHQGNQILRKVYFSGVTAAWTTSCAGSPFACSANYQGGLFGVKNSDCFLGGPGWMDYGYIYYKNGAYDKFEYRGSIIAAAGSECSAPIGTSCSLTVAILSYTV